MKIQPRAFLKQLFLYAVSNAHPSQCMKSDLPEPPIGKTIVVGAGKASASMAQTIEKYWNGTLEGLVITRYGHMLPTNKIKVVEASHPVPDEIGLCATKQILKMVEPLDNNDLVICLISGGGSSLLTLPSPGISLLDKQSITQKLLMSGATISEINCVRKHLSIIKGGYLGIKSYPAKLITLAISDVPGDDPSVIASGPTVGDPTTLLDAERILDNYKINPPAHIVEHLKLSKNETPKPEDERLSNSIYKIIATPSLSLKAASELVKANGLRSINLGDNLEGDARTMAIKHAKIAKKSAYGTVLLSGGETTVTVKGNGQGGRNSEYGLALAKELAGAPGIFAIVCDTDGIDGTEDNAGVIITPDSLSRAKNQGLSIELAQEKNDSYNFFRCIDDLVVTGPTFTNVNDFRAILILPET
tara:strand:- start:128 stop:1378 length:1251 start_codon:yes stop_codon:yes gene_type:complete